MPSAFFFSTRTRVLAGLLVAVGVGPLASEAFAQTTINPSNAFAWSGNSGWINWRGDGSSGARVGEFYCSGHLYAANLGWISLGNGSPANGIRYQNKSATDFGVNRDSQGRLTGWAYGANIGWLIFTNRTLSGAAYDAPSVDLHTGRISGFVYSPNLGWVSLSNSIASVQTDFVERGPDQDLDQMADAWELEHVGNTTTMDSTTDFDSDGFSDVGEYLADTDPLLDTDYLYISRLTVAPESHELSITWPSKSTRVYRIQVRPRLGESGPWSDSGLGVIQPSAGGITSREFLLPYPKEGYLQVEALTPLAPPPR
jgi:hypothetical protein